MSTKRTKRAKRLYSKQRNEDSSSCKRIRCDDLSNYIVIGSDVSFSDVIEDVYPEVSTSFAIDHPSLEQSQIFSFEESYELSQYILGNDDERSALEDEYSISSWTTGGEELTPSEDIANPSLASSLVEYHPSFFTEYSPIPNDSEDAFEFSRQVSDDDESSQEISLAHAAMSTPSLCKPLSPVSSSSSIESSCSESSSSQQKEQNYIYEDFMGFLDDANCVACFSSDEGYSNIADVKPDTCSSDNDRFICTANDVKPDICSSDDDRFICTDNDVKPDICSSDDDRYTCTANDLKSEACSSFDKGHANIDANLRSDTCSSKDKEITKIDTNEKRSTSASTNEPVNETSSSSNASGAIVLSNLDVLLGRGKKATTHPGNKRFREIVAKMKPRYYHSARSDKTRIANQIIETVHKYGGRFLQYCEKSSSYIEVDDHVARKKSSQRLRELNE